MTEKTPETTQRVATIDELLRQRAAPTRGRKVMPYVTLVILLTLSLLAWQHFESLSEQRTRRDFDEYVEAMVMAIRRRLVEYEMIMQGGAGLFSSSTEVTREEWRNYALYQRVKERFPGLQALGVARRVRLHDLQQHLQEIRTKGYSDYTIRPPGEREEYCPVIFVEPFDDESKPVVGFDLLSEPLRRTALELAGSSGSSAISEKIVLIHGFGKLNGPGFLLCLPIYEIGKPLLTVEERHDALWGYVISAFHIEDLIRGLSPNTSHKIEFEIFDGPVPSPSALMFDSHVSSNDCSDAVLAKNKLLDLYGRQWTLLFHTTPAFESQTVDRLPKTLLAGSIVISLLIFLFLKMLEGTGERALAYAHDITHELEEERAWLGTVIDTAMDAIIALDHDGLILVWNSSAVRMFGYTAEEALGKDFYRFLTPPRFYDTAMKGFRSFQKTGGSAILGLTREIFALRKDGEKLPVEITVSARKSYEKDGIVAVIRDITERKQAEGERVARQAADAANHQKSLFLSNMSHEIRTPMNAILGFAQILERDPNLSSKQREQIGSINRSGQHLLALINDILDMSKIEAGMNVLKPVAFSLHDLIDDLAMMFRSRAEAKKLQFSVERDESVPYCVMADEGKIRQVLINLLGNAIKFTAEGGVSMRVRALSPASTSAEKAKTLQLTVEVEDSGPGIPATDLTNIFTPFGQGEAGVLAGGTGLGLPISRSLAEIMGGVITVETEVGRGSCFRFDIPIELSDAAVKKKNPSPRLVTGLEPGTGPFRILVVDDMQLNRDLLCDLLRPLGFEICQAENGAEALTVFEEWAPHAVLMDMKMPVMDGYEATRRIKATEKGHGTPVIAVTASAFKDSEDQVLATGVSAYLRKPFRPEELWQAIGDCLGLRYVYANESSANDNNGTQTQLSAIDPARVAALPADILQAMRQSVDEGDMMRLVELIDQVEPQNADVAQALRFLANQYDYVRLGHLLEKGGKNDA